MTYINTIIIDGLSFALPLFIMAIGGIYCERSGVTNLAIEGLQGMGAWSPGCSPQTARLLCSSP